MASLLSSGALSDAYPASSFWQAAVKAQVERYATSESGGTPRTKRTEARTGSEARTEDSYRPGPLSRPQLRRAAEEFVKRCHDNGNDKDLPFVLVSRNCNKMPSRRFELAALESSGNVSKLWYALTETKDLLIVKYVSDTRSIAHGDAIGEIVRCVGNFGVQHRRGLKSSLDGIRLLASGISVAPDIVLQRKYPPQGIQEQLQTSLIVELEYENRGPRELMLQLGEYTLQPYANFVLGIKVYKRSGPPASGGAKRPFAAIALLWRRGAAAPGAQVSFVQAWSFGSCALSDASRNAFCRQYGTLQQVQPAQITHPVNHTVETDALVIPNALLLQGVSDEHGNQIPIRPTDNDLTLDLGEVRSIFDRTLPP